MNADIRELSETADLVRLSDLFAEIWGRPDDPSSDMLKALAHSGNYVAGAFVERRLVGGLVGWLGGDPRDHLHMHSHILGVLPGADARGIGFELKQHQRRWCLERGVRVMEWTTDPLVRRNAYFNLAKLGAQAPRYLINFYGEMQDGLNKGEQSDRLLIRWQLDSEKAEAAASGRARELDAEKLLAWRRDAIISVSDSGEPILKKASARVLLCQVPEDIVALRHTNPELAREWRRALRESLGAAMDSGYAISGATRSGWYVLESVTQ